MEKKKEFIINITYIALICALVYLFVNYLLNIISPFVLGFIFAYFAVKLSRNVVKSDKRIHRILSLIIIYIFIVILITLIISLGLDKIGEFIKSLPSFYTNTIEPNIVVMEKTLEDIGKNLPEFVRDSLDGIADSFFEALKTILSSSASGVMNLTKNVITSAPEALISIIVTIIASFYFVCDYEQIAEWFTSLLPDRAIKTFYDIKDFIENTLLKILGSYIVIMGITFVELLIGLTIIGISNSGMWALLIAFMDILPILGVGTVLIPWSIGCLLTGRVMLGVSLLVLYLIIAVIRNIIEPKFVGTNLGLHPLATLVSMIVGVRLFGAIGMFGLPLTLSFFVSRKNKDNK